MSRDSSDAYLLLNHPLIIQILGDLERDAVDVCVNASDDADIKRLSAAIEVRVVRALRHRLEILAREPKIHARNIVIA